MSSLATVADLEDLLGVTIADGSDDADRAALLLSLASATVRRTAQQTFERVVDDIAVLRGTWSPVLELPEQPVESVTTVETSDGLGNWTATTAWEHVTTGIRANAGHWNGPEQVVRVTYTHGTATIPEDVQAIVLQAAARAWANPAGVLSQNLDGYAVTFGGASAFERGGVTLTKWETDLLRSLRPRR